ncbi:MAG: hypothetical protein [Olavius algarvensis Gamma 1 endosymbiont]|nr:MAG: hypothetical protein [Olavius algarvensis Gamma 1 endosymbiont]
MGHRKANIDTGIHTYEWRMWRLRGTEASIFQPQLRVG